jgi:hypothetical protein
MKKRKPTKAQRQLAADWAALQSRWENVAKFARTTSPTGRVVEQSPHLQSIKPRTSEAQRVIKSFTTPGGSTALMPTKIYTGSAMLGVAIMHKSNMIPIFNNEAAEDVAKMRRG